MDTAATPQSGTTPPAPAPTQGQGSGTAAAPADLPPDLANLIQNPEAFKARLGEERKAAQARLLKDLGVDKVDDLRALVEAHRTAEDQRKGREVVLEEKLQALSPRAARAEALEASLVRFLDQEEASIPEASRKVLELAPPREDVVARLDWITRAKAQGILSPTPPATLAGGGGRTPPAAAPVQSGGKDPRNMTAEEWATYRRTWALRHAQGGNQ